MEKGARLLVPLRLALLAIRRKLISGGSHNWGGGASETTNFRSWKFYLISKHFFLNSEVEFVHPVSAGGSVKFLASGVNFSIFTHFLCFFVLKLLKLSEIDGVKFLT